MHTCLLIPLLLGADWHGASSCDIGEDTVGVLDRISAGAIRLAPDDDRDLGSATLVFDATEEPPTGTSSARRDLARIWSATLLYSVVYPDVRKPLFAEGSVSRVGDHLRHPIRSAVEGGRDDEDPFFTNYVAHPVTWGGIGYYLRSRGHSDMSSLLMSQAHSLFWEYVLEGLYQKPSGRDLVTNLVSASVGVVLAGWAEQGLPGRLSAEVTPVAESAPIGAFGNPALAGGRQAGVGLTIRLVL